ncbi:MAG: Rdx family protein [Candidatus Poribacteria bacterium]|nr:Rdx family protein [Candidatus Poribacteria bacterium]
MPRAVSMADDLLSKYQTDVKGLTLVPGGGGCFEVSLNGKRIYSKLETGEYPTVGQITSAIEANT